MTKQIFINRNEAGQKREEFFKGIELMLKEFSKQDIDRMRTIIFNELHGRRKAKDDKKGVIIGV